jgi:hypothetical protein
MLTAEKIDSWRKGRPIWVTKQGGRIRAAYEDWECDPPGLLIRYRIEELPGSGIRRALVSDIEPRDP